MLFFKLCRVLFCSIFLNAVCHSHQAGIQLTDLGNVELPTSPSGGAQQCFGADVADRSTNNTRGGNLSNAIKFRLPFMDMEIQHERNLYLVHEQLSRQLFVVHGNELLHLHLSRQEKRLSLIGVLFGGGTDAELLGVEVVSWHNYFIFVLAMNEQMDVYQISASRIQQRIEATKSAERSREPNPIFEPIQQLTLTASYRRHFLTAPDQDQVLLLVAVNFSKLNSRLRTFEWALSYFDPVEELMIPPVTVLSLMEGKPKYLITGRVIKHQPKTIISVFEIVLPEMKLQKRQTLTVPSRTVHAFTFRDNNYLVACSTNASKCSSFHMVTGGQFEPHLRRSAQDLSFHRLQAGQHFLVAVRNDVVRVFTDARFDCYGSFTSNLTDVSAVLAYLNNKSEDYVLLVYNRVFSTLVRMVEIAAADGTALSRVVSNATLSQGADNSLPSFEREFEDVIGKLRSLLLRRNSAMDVFRKAAQLLSPKLSQVTVRKPIRIRGGNIGLVKMVGSGTPSPVQILERITETRQLAKLHRNRRSADQQNRNDAHVVKGHLRVRSLRVTNLVFEDDLLPGFSLDNLAQPWPILSTPFKVLTEALHTEVLVTRDPKSRTRRQVIQNETSNQHHRSPSTGIVRHLRVERINDVPWIKLFDSFFLKTRHTKIKGRLVLNSATKIAHLRTEELNALPVENLFNLRRPQLIYTNIHMSNMVVPALKVNSINGLQFAEDVVFRGLQDILISGPVVLYRASIAGDIFVETNSAGYRDGNHAKREEESEQSLQQIYSGKVIIKGSLTVNNVLLQDRSNTKVLLDDLPFSERILQDNYLLYNASQSFSMPVVFGNAKISTPTLRAKYLNDHAASDHLVDDDNGNIIRQLVQIRPMLAFLSARVDGNVVCSPNGTKVREMNEDAVRHGDIANITGIKRFAAPLVVDHLMTLQLNQLSCDDMVMRSELKNGLQFVDTKIVEAISVSEATFIEKELNASHLNNFQLDELLNHNYYFEKLSLRHLLEAQHIVFSKLNNIDLVEVQKVIKSAQERGSKLRLKTEMVIEGNLKISKDVHVDRINDNDWLPYRSSLVSATKDATVAGRKRFLADLTVRHSIQTMQLNGQNISIMFENILRSSKPQLITGSYTLGRLHFGNVNVGIINEVQSSAFVDTRSFGVTIDSDLIIPKLVVHGNAVNCYFERPLRLVTVLDQVLQIAKRNWPKMVVLGNSLWNCKDCDSVGQLRDQQDQLKYLQSHAVRFDENRTITGNVQIHQPFLSKMTTTKTFQPSVDSELIRKDALLRNSPVAQVVLASKRFLMPLHFNNVSSSIAKSRLNMTYLNGIDIHRLNASLYRISSGSMLSGTFNFQRPVRMRDLSITGCVNGVNVGDLYQVVVGESPPVQLLNFEVEKNVQLDKINELDFNYLLSNRILKTGIPVEATAALSFKRFVVETEVMLQSINGIDIRNIVFRQSTQQQQQAVTGQKIIAGDLRLIGPVHVMHLNGNHLLDTYQHSVLANGNYQFDCLTLNDMSFQGGLVLANPSKLLFFVARTADGEDEQLSIEPTDFIEREKQQHQLIDDEQKQVMEHIENGQHIVYLDYDYETQLVWAEANETIYQTFSYETTRGSSCGREFMEVQLAASAKRMFLRNLTNNHIKSTRYNLSIKAENLCAPNQRTIKSKVKLSGPPNLSRVFGMRKLVESADICQTSQPHIALVLLHAIDTLNGRHEVRVLRVDSKHGEVRDWQSINETVGRLMRLYQMPQNGSAILATTGLYNNYPALRLYYLDENTVEFTPEQTIRSYFDIVEMSRIHSQRHHLVLSCRHCQRISIYERAHVTSSLSNSYAASNGKYQIFQMVRVSDMLIQNVHPFVMGEGEFYLLVLPELAHGRHYHVYKFGNILGWQLVLRGHFENSVQLIMPLIGQSLTDNTNDLYPTVSSRTDDPVLMLLLCGSKHECVLIKALFRQ